MAGVLIADDEEMQRDILKDILELEKYDVYQAGNISDAMDILRKEKIDIIISDYKMEDETGEELLEKTKFFYPDIEFILITAYGTIETAVSCMQKGAYSFLTKPVNIKELKEVGLDGLLERFDGGLHAEIKATGEGLSLGQKQIIAFIRAVIRRPDLLILDEATANIDTVTEQLLEDILQKLPKSATRIVIAHRLNTIESADEIYFVNSGTVTKAG